MPLIPLLIVAEFNILGPAEFYDFLGQVGFNDFLGRGFTGFKFTFVIHLP